MIQIPVDPLPPDVRNYPPSLPEQIFNTVALLILLVGLILMVIPRRWMEWVRQVAFGPLSGKNDR